VSPARAIEESPLPTARATRRGRPPSVAVASTEQPPSPSARVTRRRLLNIAASASFEEPSSPAARVTRRCRSLALASAQEPQSSPDAPNKTKRRRRCVSAIETTPVQRGRRPKVESPEVHDGRHVDIKEPCGESSSYEDADFNVDDDDLSLQQSSDESEAYVETASTRRRRTRASRTSPLRNGRDKRNEESDFEYHDLSDDKSGNEEKLEEEPEKRPKKRRGRPPSKKKPRPRKRKKGGRRGRKPARKSVDGSDDEISYDSPGSGSSDEYKPPTKKKRGRQPQNKKSEDKLFLPKLPRWPPVDFDRLETLAHYIMDKMDEADKQNLFAEPVLTSYPEISENYLATISSPMDFRTIREERIPSYKELSELQDDLIQVFRNCCTFNGERSEFWTYAVEIWTSLTEVFKDVCHEEGVMLPRRW